MQTTTTINVFSTRLFNENLYYSSFPSRDQHVTGRNESMMTCMPAFIRDCGIYFILIGQDEIELQCAFS